jgi:hypothetical protein
LIIKNTDQNIKNKYRTKTIFTGIDLSSIDIFKSPEALKVIEICKLRRFEIADKNGEYSIKLGNIKETKHYENGECILSNINGEAYLSLSKEKFIEKYKILYLAEDRRVEETVEELPNVKTSIITRLLSKGLYCIETKNMLENSIYALNITEPFKYNGEYGYKGDWIVKINNAQAKIVRNKTFGYLYVPFLRKAK